MAAGLLDRDRLVKLLGLLGSDHDGERANAAAAADRLVRAAGLTWRDLILPELPQSVRRPAVKDALAFVLARQSLLTAWERKFCVSLYTQHSAATDKQAAILAQIVEKCRLAEAWAA